MSSASIPQADRRTQGEMATSAYVFLPLGNTLEQKPLQEDRCELLLSFGQGQLLFSLGCSGSALDWIRRTWSRTTAALGGFFLSEVWSHSLRTSRYCCLGRRTLDADITGLGLLATQWCVVMSMQWIHCLRNMSQSCETLTSSAPKDILHLQSKLLSSVITGFCTNYLQSNDFYSWHSRRL